MGQEAVKFSDKYPDAYLFQEPMQGIFVVPDYYPCVECGAPTRYLDFQTGKSVEGVAICSEECCAIHAIGRSL